MTTRAKRETDWQDPIVAEVRAAREALFAAAGYDIEEFCRRARAAQADSGHLVVTRRSRRPSNPEVNTMGVPHRRSSPESVLSLECCWSSFKSASVMLCSVPTESEARLRQAPNMPIKRSVRVPGLACARPAPSRPAAYRRRYAAWIQANP